MMENKSQSEIRRYYASAIEKDRLESENFLLEGVRTKEIIQRYLSKAIGNIRIADIGGGAGYYALWLAKQGHAVSMIDLSEDNVEIAKNAAKENNISLNDLRVADATELPYADSSFDIALMLGPLYHLTNRILRIKALQEARRILKPGGILIAAIISRYASLFDGYQRDLVTDPEFFQIMTNDLQNGIHINNTTNPEYFTTAFFHTPQEIKDEITSSGLTFEKLLAVEGFGWIIGDLKNKLKNEEYRQNLLSTITSIESSPDLIALSPHIIAVSAK